VDCFVGLYEGANGVKSPAQNVSGIVVIARLRTSSSTVAGRELLAPSPQPDKHYWGTQPGRLSGPPPGRRLSRDLSRIEQTRHEALNTIPAWPLFIRVAGVQRRGPTPRHLICAAPARHTSS